jgi:hypothetical protein
VIRDTQANLFVEAGGGLHLSPAAAGAGGGLPRVVFAAASFRCFLICWLASFSRFFFDGSLVSYIFRTNSPFLLFFVCAASSLSWQISWS